MVCAVAYWWTTLRILVGEEVLDHSGLDYYEGGQAGDAPLIR